jgi:hypothetical protein
MNALYFAVVTVAPDAFGFGRATFGDAERRFYADPTRFTAPFTPPEVGERVAVYRDTATAGAPWIALWAIGRGSPSYRFGGD